VITPILPATPVPAVTGPFTGGQYWAQAPLQLDLVEVSGTNQYSVKPLALVSTFTPLIVVDFTIELDEPAATALGEEPPPELPEPDVPDDPELPHAAATRATAASPAGAHHRVPITHLRSQLDLHTFLTT
jgi:hypothetical protein